jgi:hypothetical protein
MERALLSDDHFPADGMEAQPARALLRTTVHVNLHRPGVLFRGFGVGVAGLDKRSPLKMLEGVNA